MNITDHRKDTEPTTQRTRSLFANADVFTLWVPQSWATRGGYGWYRWRLAWAMLRWTWRVFTHLDY